MKSQFRSCKQATHNNAFMAKRIRRLSQRQLLGKIVNVQKHANVSMPLWFQEAPKFPSFYFICKFLWPGLLIPSELRLPTGAAMAWAGPINCKTKNGKIPRFPTKASRGVLRHLNLSPLRKFQKSTTFTVLQLLGASAIQADVRTRDGQSSHPKSREWSRLTKPSR